MADHQKTYDEGLRDGKLIKLEETVSKHSDRLDSHSKRMRSLERIAWAAFGIVGFIEFLPVIYKSMTFLQQ